MKENWSKEFENEEGEKDNGDPDELIDLPKAVIFVPSTENSTLAKEIRSVITHLNL